MCFCYHTCLELFFMHGNQAKIVRVIHQLVPHAYGPFGTTCRMSK